MYYLVLTIHVLICITLTLVILLQVGRGHGLTGSMGGEMTRSLFGTQTASVLIKATTICGSLFLVTCLMLGIVHRQRERSILERMGVKIEETAKTQSQPAVTPSAPTDASAPASP